MRLTNTVALITGAKRIGLVVAESLAGRGVSVAFSYARSKDEAEDGVSARARARPARDRRPGRPLGSAGAAARSSTRTVAELGRLDILINMASVYRQRRSTSSTVDDWDAVDQRRSCARPSSARRPRCRTCARRAAAASSTSATGCSKSGRPRYAGFLPYYVAKAGVIALTEALALELAPDNILVNAIAPGPILAPPGTTDEELRAVERSTPLGRWGGELEIAKAVLALLD